MEAAYVEGMGQALVASRDVAVGERVLRVAALVAVPYSVGAVQARPRLESAWLLQKLEIE